MFQNAIIQIFTFSFFFFVTVSSFGNNVCDDDKYYPSMMDDDEHCWNNPDVFSNIDDITKRHNFEIESYKYQNSEGYIMTLHRIPSKDQSKPVIYLQHGILVNSLIFVGAGNRSLAFFLSSLGYDVWMGNLRGVRDSKRHVSLTAEDPEFWNYNLDNLATVDVRENLQFIAKKTGKAGSIIYLGHSMGTTLSYMYASKYPVEAQYLLKGIISLAPVGFLENPMENFVDGVSDILSEIVGLGSPILNSIIGIAKHAINLAVNIGIKAFSVSVFLRFSHDEDLLAKLATVVCYFFPSGCRRLINFGSGPSDQLASEDLPLVTSLAWGSVSNLQYIHFMQIISGGKLQMFDFKENNREHYGQNQPPEYHLSKIEVPLFLFYSLNDTVATERNAEKLYEAVGSEEKGLFKIPEANDSPSFNHLDLLVSKNVDKYLFPRLQQVLSDNLGE